MKHNSLLTTLTSLESIGHDIECLAKAAQVFVRSIENADQDTSASTQFIRACAAELGIMVDCLASFHIEELADDIKDL